MAIKRRQRQQSSYVAQLTLQCPKKHFTRFARIPKKQLLIKNIFFVELELYSSSSTPQSTCGLTTDLELTWTVPIFSISRPVKTPIENRRLATNLKKRVLSSKKKRNSQLEKNNRKGWSQI